MCTCIKYLPTSPSILTMYSVSRCWKLINWSINWVFFSIYNSKSTYRQRALSTFGIQSWRSTVSSDSAARGCSRRCRGSESWRTKPSTMNWGKNQSNYEASRANKQMCIKRQKSYSWYHLDICKMYQLISSWCISTQITELSLTILLCSISGRKIHLLKVFR